MVATFGRRTKLLLGLVTLWPAVYSGLFCVFAMVLALGSMRDDDAADRADALFGAIAVAHAATLIVTLLLTVLYIVDLFKSDRVLQDKKALWAVVLLLGGIVSMPIYWYLYVWRVGAPRQL